MTSLKELHQKHLKELASFQLKQKYNTVFEYQDMMILSVIYGIVETIAIEELYLVVMKMMEEKPPLRYGSGVVVPINNYSELIKAIEKLTIHIVGDSNKHYKVRFINCDKMWNSEGGHIEGNLWIRLQIPDPQNIYSREKVKRDTQISLLIERGDVE